MESARESMEGEGLQISNSYSSFEGSVVKRNRDSSPKCLSKPESSVTERKPVTSQSYVMNDKEMKEPHKSKKTETIWLRKEMLQML